MSNKNIDNKVEALLAIDHSKVKAPVLKAALEQLQKENDARAQRDALDALRAIESNIQHIVGQIRHVRSTEKTLLARLKLMNEAKEAFLANGNFSELNTKLLEISNVGTRGDCGNK